MERSKCCTRYLRIFLFFLMVLSVCLFFSPITSLIGYIPLIGKFIAGALGLVIFLAAIIICIPLFIIAIAISWICWHPKVGYIILGIGLAIGVGVIIFLSVQNSKAVQTEPAKHLLGFNKMI